MHGAPYCVASKAPGGRTESRTGGLKRFEPVGGCAKGMRPKKSSLLLAMPLIVVAPKVTWGAAQHKVEKRRRKRNIDGRLDA